MRIPNWTSVTALLLTAAPLPAPLRAQATRRILPDTLLLVRSIGDSGSEVLYEPQILSATPDGRLVIFDSGEEAVREFTADGREGWHFGRKGQGPGEFEGASDVDVEANGDILVLDNINRRITRLDSTGKLLGMTRIPNGVEPTCLLPPTAEDRLVVGTLSTRLLWQSMSTNGEPERSQVLPPGVSYQSELVGEASSAFLASGAVMVYRWSGTMVLLDGDGAVRKVLEGIEPLPFPVAKSHAAEIPGLQNAHVTKVDPEAPQAALSVSARDHRIFVLFEGTTGDAGKVVDIYDDSRGAYVGSVALPVRPISIAALPGGRLATLEADMVPVIRIWKIERK